MKTENGEYFVVQVALPLVRGLPSHPGGPSGGNKFAAPNRYLKEHLPSQFAGELIQRKFRTVLPAARSASHPNGGGAGLRLGC